jgi:CBS domain containing-hemolysin-like protein
VNYSTVISISLAFIVSVLNSLVGYIVGNIAMKKEEMSKCISLVLSSMVIRIVVISVLVGYALTIAYFNHIAMMIALVIGIFISLLIEVTLIHLSFERKRKESKAEKKKMNLNSYQLQTNFIF